MVRRGMAGKNKAGRDRQGTAWNGRHGMDGLGVAAPDKDGFGKAGVTRPGQAWTDRLRLGQAWTAYARQAGNDKTWSGLVRQRRKWRGNAWQARPGVL